MMAYCTTLEAPMADQNSWVREVHPDMNIDLYHSEACLLLDRALSRITSVGMLKYPKMDSEIVFKTVN